MTKKLRFETFKRDGFCCQYCGRTPPEVVLEVDHIIPISEGGLDTIDNFITACFDCNRGKGKISLDKIPKELSQKLALLKEKEEQIKAYNKFLIRKQKSVNIEIEEIENIFEELFPDRKLSDTFKNASLKRFLKHLPKEKIIESLYIAYGKKHSNPEEMMHYFCGIVWNKIKEK